MNNNKTIKIKNNNENKEMSIMIISELSATKP